MNWELNPFKRKKPKNRKIEGANAGEPIPEWYWELGFDRGDHASSGSQDNRSRNENQLKKMAYLIEDMGMSPEMVYSRTPKELNELIEGSQILNKEKQEEIED